nr:uncharacterized protein LOC129279955 [Lytechinus pictus]
MPNSPHTMPVLVWSRSSGNCRPGRQSQMRFLRRKMLRVKRVLKTHWRLVMVSALTLTTIYFVLNIRKKAINSTRRNYADMPGFQRDAGRIADMFFNPPEDEFDKEFRDKSRLPPSVETMEDTPKLHTGDTLLGYFLTMYVDGMEITWSSAVNSRSLLFLAMQDYMLMMVEADVRVKWSDTKKKTNGSVLIAPIPTKLNEDSVSLQRYLYFLSRYSNKGIQLNFPDIETARIVLPQLNGMKSQLHAPVWLHADVLPGPNLAEVPVDPSQFIGLVQSNFPSSTLLLGWATSWSPDAPQIRYSWYNVIEMAKTCAGAKQPVSFAVRVIYARKSIRQLRFLLSLTSRFSVTVWTDVYDIMPLPDLVHFRKNMDPKRVHYNLPENFMESIKSVNGQQPAPIDPETMLWNRNLWQPVLMDDVSLVFLGAEQAVLEGEASWIVSKIPYQAELQAKGKTVVVEGKFQFLSRDSQKVVKGEAARVVIRSSGVNPPSPDKVQGVQLVVRPDGFIELSEINMQHASLYDLRTSGHLPRNDCYEFKIVDRGEDYPIFCEVKLLKCEEEDSDLEALSVSLHFKVPYEPESQMYYVAVNPIGGKQPLVIENLVVYS